MGTGADAFINSDIRRIRMDDGSRLDEASRNPPPDVTGAPSFVGKTTTITTYPTTAGVFYGVTPQVILGTETEGAAATIGATSGAGVILALNVGTAIPASGTYVVCTFVKSRWIFRYDG